MVRGRRRARQAGDTGPADEKGVLQGALEIDLKPGWKTYWRDPGDAGVPPTIDATASSNVASAELSFPAPHRFDEASPTGRGTRSR